MTVCVDEHDKATKIFILKIISTYRETKEKWLNVIRAMLDRLSDISNRDLMSMLRTKEL